MKLIPTLLRNGTHPQIRDVTHAREMRVFGGYTLDGELFENEPDSPVGTPEAASIPVVVHP